MHTTSSGQGHETLVGTVIGEVLQVDPDTVRVTRPDSLNSLPSGTPVGSRMAIMLGGAAFHAAQKLKAITDRDCRARSRHSARARGLRARQCLRPRQTANRRTWADLVGIAYRNMHRMPPGMEPGLAFSHIYPVPTGGTLPTADGRVQMYPCFSFEFHLLLLAIDSRSGHARNLALPRRPRLRHADQSQDRARHDHGRHRARHRRRAVRGVRYNDEGQ